MEYTDVFLTHDWGEDELGRSNHVRVSKVNKFLQSRGLKTWFDEERMTGNIRDKMAEGIENTKLILVFITEKYRNKVNSNNAIDNCYFEFNYATLEKSGNFMIPVVMEPRMRNPRDWKGRLGAELGTHLYVDLSEEDPEIFDSKCKELHALIEPLIAEYDKTNPPSTSTVQPVHHHHPHHQIHHKEGSAEPVHGDSKHTQPQPTGGKSNSLKTNAMAVLSIAGSMKQPSTNTNNSPLAALQALNSHNNHITTPNNLTKAAQNILSPPNSTTPFNFSSSMPSTTSETSTESTLSNSLPSNGGKFSFASSFLKSLNDHPPSSSLISSTSVHPVASSTTPKINLPSVTETSPFLQQNKAPHAQVNISTTFPSHDSHTSSFTVPKFTFGSRLPETITHNHDSSSTTTENGNFKKCPWCSSKNHANAVNCILCKKPIDGSHSSSSGSNSSKKICPWCHGKNELTSTKCSICSNSLENRHLPSDLLEVHLLNDGGNNGNVNVKVLNRSSNAGEGYDTTGIKRSPRLSLQTGSFIINHLNTVKGHAPTSNAGVSTENHIPSISFTI
mmetsp:Transcript_29591/g.32225  ORF Transcript_29591/g.32225 Transcript_29591/m.32225 type:complete len:559 (+) Transcript_29591:45-1721(+)